MFLPAKERPQVLPNLSEAVVEVPNVMTPEIAGRLKEYALNKELSGLHYRGSKDPSIQANFQTCLIYKLNDPIYELLDTYWKNYATKINSNITFIEQYEIKIYGEGDKFPMHHDSYGFVGSEFNRKINLTIQLSNEEDYEGGELFVKDHRCSKTFGTAIFYPANYWHYVSQITKGQRFCLIGHAWGPYVE